ncbi:hypothetical protein MsAm2_02200 [Methanolapillus ohkumae]|uniref:Uncharacterized protein n=1 Tax=Methanolapillus ohkumae TaxID=3028298 RepID=A0AA96V5D4_9EURY|nr:hypothetical protein MsAm2_02200 [Methanosarcinaceae archaeon Am2]
MVILEIKEMVILERSEKIKNRNTVFKKKDFKNGLFVSFLHYIFALYFCVIFLRYFTFIPICLD